MIKWIKKIFSKEARAKVDKIKYHLLLEKTYWDGRAYDKTEKDYETVKHETILDIENMVKEVSTEE
jgi:23S rRNA maturation-related 3'-5' exoribonuclease YhaM